MTETINTDLNSSQTVSHSGLASLDPRSKILLACGFILTLSLLPPGEFLLYGLLLIALLISASLSGCSPAYLVRRSVIALPFALAAVTLLFSIPGETLLTLPMFGIDISVEGAIRFASLVTRSWISVQAAILLVILTKFTDLMWGLQGLHMPSILVSVAGFTYRYLDVLRSEASRLRTARRARSATSLGGRGGGSLLWRARVTGWMVGSLMIRSMERSERIYNAMLARGYSGEVKTLTRFELRSRDYWSILVAAIAAVIVILVAHFL
ncbi:MAG: cobalt ECF transporter T component CbiQ [Candidatus Promineifilaceae bacterium]